MDESGTGNKPGDSSPELIAKEMNNEPDTKIFDNFGCNRGKWMCDDTSGPKRCGNAGSGQVL